MAMYTRSSKYFLYLLCNLMNTLNILQIITIIQFLNLESREKTSISKLLSENLNYSYNYLSKIFSKHEKITIEKYYLKFKIEKIKEFLSYNQLSIKELAYKFDYNSVSHLSNHFKKETGLSPSIYRKKNIERIGLNQL